MCTWTGSVSNGPGAARSATWRCWWRSAWGEDGYRDILGVAEGCKEDKAGWGNFLAYSEASGVCRSPELIISDKCLGLVESLAEYYPEAQWQRCMVHFYRNVFSVVPKGKVKQVATMLKAIHAQEDRPAAQEKAEAVVAKLKKLKLPAAAKLVRDGIGETLTYYAFPDKHHRQIRTNNPLERLMREIRRRRRVVGCFPDGRSALMLAAARLTLHRGHQVGHAAISEHEPLEGAQTRTARGRASECLNTR